MVLLRSAQEAVSALSWVQGYILLRQFGTRPEQRTLRCTVDPNSAYRVPGRHSLDPSSGGGGPVGRMIFV
jgi:hypothetical protein